MTTQARKKTSISKPAAPRARPQSKPAARNPLYRPWFAASAAVDAASSEESPKILAPTGFVHRNISSTRNARWSRATAATATSAAAVSMRVQVYLPPAVAHAKVSPRLAPPPVAQGEDQG